MPVHEIALPVGAKNIKPKLPVILRPSKDGDIPIAQLFGGDSFVGEVLEGQWVKGESGTGLCTAIIGSGQLNMIGSGGTYLYSWIVGQVPFLMLQNAYIDVHLKVPTSTPANNVEHRFYLATSANGDPNGVDYLQFIFARTSGGTYTITVKKNVNGSASTIYTSATVGNREGTLRFKFRPNDDVMDVYWHVGSGDVVESSDELTLSDDTLDLTFELGHPAYAFYTEDQDSGHVVSSEGVKVDYPDTGISYDLDVADVGKGDVKCYDTMGEVSEVLWRRVYAEDHDFVGDCVIENGLIRLVVDDGAQRGLEVYCWSNTYWEQLLDSVDIYLDDDAKTLNYAFLKQISQMKSSEEIQLLVRLCETGTESDSQNADVLITLARGKQFLTFEIDSVTPSQSIRFSYGHPTSIRWSYVGDVELSDDNFSQTVTNTVMSDNFMVKFAHTGVDFIGFVATNQKPAAGLDAFYSYQSDYIALASISVADFDDIEIYVGLIEYADNSDLFIEAEDATFTGQSIADGLASAGYMVELDAQSEYVYHELIGITDIPVGRYLLIARVKDVNQIADDLEMFAYNSTESRFLNEEMAEVKKTVTDTYAFYQIVFDVVSADSGDTLEFFCQKGTATANTIKVDYFLIIPITDGASYVQDMAHNAVRTMESPFRLTDLATFELYSGIGLGFGIGLTSYTDAMAVAAVESELTLDLLGVLTCKDIKNKSDSDGIYVGAGDDLRIHHDGTNTYLTNTEGDLILQNVGGDIRLETSEFFLDVTGKVQFRDKEDSDAVLWELDSTARTLKLGTAIDPLTVTINDVAISGDDADAIHDNVSDEIHQIALKGSPISADEIVIEDSEASWAKKRSTIASLGAGGPGSGTPWDLPVWDAAGTALTDSMLSQDSGGTVLTVAGDMTVAETIRRTASNQVLILLGGDAGDTGASLAVTGTTYASPASVIITLSAGVSDAEFRIMDYDGVTTWTEAFTIDSDGFIVHYGKSVSYSDNDVIAWDSASSKFTVQAPVIGSHDFDTHTGDVDLVDLASYVQGSIIIGGDVDWEALGAGTEDYVLKMGAAEPAWGQVDWSELTGSQPAPINHNLIDTTGHPVSGLTAGHFLKALTITTYGFAAHGLGAGDVGAYTTAEVDDAIDTDITTHAGDDNAHHEVIETADVETIITAELVDGQSIDLAIDDLILTHKNIATAHQDAPSLISTHALDDNVHHEVIEQSDVETIITAELVDGQSIDLAIDALILTHKNIAAAHHAKWTTGDTEGVITAELVNGQSIDNAIDSLIGTHAGDDDAHHALVTVAAYPLALTGQQVAFRYDVNFFKLVANSLVVGTDNPETDDILTWDGTDAVWGPSAGGMSAHDLTGGYHTEDATGGAGNVLRASGATAFAWATLAHGDLSDAPANAHHVAFVSSDAASLILTHKNISTAHHTKYTNANAVSAVQAANPLNLTYGLSVGNGSFDVSSSGNITDCGSITMGGALSGATTGAFSSYVDMDYSRYSDDPIATSNRITIGNVNSLGVECKIMAENGYSISFSMSSVSTGISTNAGKIAINDDLYVAGNVTLANSRDLLVETSNVSTIGTGDSSKFLRAWIATVTTGDVEFSNRFRITEVHHPDWDGDKNASAEEMWAQSKEDGAIPGLIFSNGRGEEIARLDEDGHFYIRGNLYERSDIFN